MNPTQLASTMELYRQQQAIIDKLMPESMMVIGKQSFRKKSYWRAVAIAFSLRVECVRSELVHLDTDWGYDVVYRAIRPNGTYTDGDGGCMASEKLSYKWDYVNGKRQKTEEIDWVKTKQNQTVHNVRSHAHTRAFNRAVSNCVGFGEVSAEEVTQ